MSLIGDTGWVKAENCGIYYKREENCLWRFHSELSDRIFSYAKRCVGEFIDEFGNVAPEVDWVDSCWPPVEVDFSEVQDDLDELEAVNRDAVIDCFRECFAKHVGIAVGDWLNC